MKQRRAILGPALVGIGLLFAGGGTASLAADSVGFRVPECAVVDEVTGYVYVSNINGPAESWWSDDGNGFISRLKPNGTLDRLRWRSSTKQAPLHSPKGMCILGRTLYVADNTRVVSYSLTSARSGVILVPGARQLNDMATDGRDIYVTDASVSRIWRLDRSGRGAHRVIQAPPAVNGITFAGGKMYAVSWDQHDLYEVDPSGKQAPKPFGIGKPFKALDGIEGLADGSFIVSDFNGNQVCLIPKSRQGVKKLASVVSPADIGINRKTRRLFVPLFMKNAVEVYTLPSEE
ncbi:MAG: hypothetical protein GX774_01530 [Armatimonadetes bacterium]|jgi:DNA-binding beta-propeller fold protein YncE|nr:hypothetical protein [Armatimonadota bacterium]